MSTFCNHPHATAIASLLAAALMCGGGCYSLERDMQAQGEIVEQIIESQQTLIHVDMSWHAIVEQLPESPVMRRAAYRIDSAERSERLVWLDLIPNLELRSRHVTDFSLRNILDLDTIRHEAILLLFLNRYLDLPSNLYRAHLQQARAGFAARVEYKALVANVWHQVARQQQLQAQLEEALQLRTALQTYFPDERLPAYLDEASLRSLERDIHQSEIDLGQTIGLPGYAVHFDGSDKPPDWPVLAADALKTRAQETPLQMDADWMALYALELCASRARQRGVVMNYWPDLSGYINLPNVNLERPGDTQWDSSSLSMIATYRPLEIFRLGETMDGLEASHELLAASLVDRVAQELEILHTYQGELEGYDLRLAELDELLERIEDPELLRHVPHDRWQAIVIQRHTWLRERRQTAWRRSQLLIQVWLLTSDASPLFPQELTNHDN